MTMAGNHVLRSLNTIKKYLRKVQFSSASSQPSLHLSKNDVLIDEKVQITVKGLAKNQKVTLHSLLENSSKLFAACGHYVANEAGEVDTFQHSSLGGTFKGLESMGLFWGMEHQHPEKMTKVYKKDVTTPFHVKIAVHDGFLEFKDLPWSKDFPCLTQCDLRRHFCVPGVRRIPVKENGLHGTLYLPPGKGPFPAVIEVPGLRGGIFEQRPPLLTSHGFAGLCLGYILHEDLPKNERELDYNYFLRAYDWLVAHPSIDENAMGGIATCIGGAYLGIVAMNRPSLKCIIGINAYYAPIGVDQVIEGEQIKTMAFDHGQIIRTPDGLVGRKMFEDRLEHPFVPMWRHGAKILHFLGLEDQNVNPKYARMFQKAIPQEFQENFHISEYPDTGHIIDLPYTPFCKGSYNPVYGEYLVWGGNPKAATDAQEDSWFKTLDFLHANLKK